MRRTSWLFYKRGQGFELGTTENRAGLELGAFELQVQHSNHAASTTCR